MRFSLFIMGWSLILLAGCETMPEGAGPLPPQVQVVNYAPETVYVAAQQAFKRLDFVLTHTAMNRLEAASAIHTSEAFGNSRQLVAKVAIHESAPGKAEVELWVTEETSSPSMGGTRREPLRENGFFGLYFAMLQQVLLDQPTDKRVEKK